MVVGRLINIIILVILIQQPIHSITIIISILLVLAIQKPIVGKSILIILVTRWWGSWRSRVAGRFHQPDADDGGDDAEPPLQGPPLPSHEGACRESKQLSSYFFSFFAFNP